MKCDNDIKYLLNHKLTDRCVNLYIGDLDHFFTCLITNAHHWFDILLMRAVSFICLDYYFNLLDCLVCFSNQICHDNRVILFSHYVVIYLDK